VKLRGIAALAVIAGAAVVAVAAATVAGSSASARIDRHNLPLGDGKYSTAKASRGHIYLCHENPGGGGAMRDGPWIHADGTWDSTAKAVVDGSVSWPQAYVRIKRRGGVRTFESNDLPTDHTTGVFPIRPSDDAYQYDPNPNAIEPQSLRYQLPAHPVKGRPQCIGGEVGVAVDGVEIFDGLDAPLRDAPAHEIQDHCDGHPNEGDRYHYHSISPCLYRGQSRHKASGLVGYAFDGFPIYGPRGPGGKLWTNADLDVCHGLTSKVEFNGRRQRIYHYVATLEYPYTVGCFRGTQIAAGVPR
jgi:hypothetical protein